MITAGLGLPCQSHCMRNLFPVILALMERLWTFWSAHAGIQTWSNGMQCVSDIHCSALSVIMLYPATASVSASFPPSLFTIQHFLVDLIKYIYVQRIPWLWTISLDFCHTAKYCCIALDCISIIVYWICILYCLDCALALNRHFKSKVTLLIKWIAGSVVALCGHTTDQGKFHVEEYCFSGLPYQTAPNLDQCLTQGEDR